MGKEVHSRLNLRKLTPDDVEFMMELINDPETVRYIPGLIQDAETMTAWVNSLDDNTHEYIVLLNGAVHIGECSLTVSGSIGEIGIMLLSAYWGNGYGTETIIRLMKIAEELGIKEITAMTDARNTVLIHILMKLGFQKNAQGWFLPACELNNTDALGKQDMEQYAKEL